MTNQKSIKATQKFSYQEMNDILKFLEDPHAIAVEYTFLGLSDTFKRYCTYEFETLAEKHGDNITNSDNMITVLAYLKHSTKQKLLKIYKDQGKNDELMREWYGKAEEDKDVLALTRFERAKWEYENCSINLTDGEIDITYSSDEPEVVKNLRKGLKDSRIPIKIHISC